MKFVVFLIICTTIFQQNRLSSVMQGALVTLRLLLRCSQFRLVASCNYSDERAGGHTTIGFSHVVGVQVY